LPSFIDIVVVVERSRIPACQEHWIELLALILVGICRRTPKGGAWRSEDEIALVSAGDGDVEQGFKHTLPPEWIDTVEEIQFSISKVTQRSMSCPL
jgi:hypothetical protein